MELFNSKYVYVMWDESLTGKYGFTASTITSLQKQVNDGYQAMYEIHEGYCDKPFMSGNGNCFPFAYYDPNYKTKTAYLKGAPIQFEEDGEWHDFTLFKSNRNFDAIHWDEHKWRIKIVPEEEDIEGCRICRFKDSPCLPSDYGIDEQGICKNFVKKEEKLPDCNWGTLETLNRRVKDLEECQNEHFYRIETLEKTVVAMAEEIDRLRSNKIYIGS